MGRASDIPPDLLLQLLSYDPATGRLIWLHRPEQFFTNGASLSAKEKAFQWNARFAGKPAFGPDNGYQKGRLLGCSAKAHRVAWAMFYRKWPTFIDHINGDRSDNRIVNLREVTLLENGRNQRRHKTNTSGFAGVYSVRGKWQATLRVSGKSHHLGTFADRADAIAARIAALHREGFHPNHGRPSNGR